MSVSVLWILPILIAVALVIHWQNKKYSPSSVEYTKSTNVPSEHSALFALASSMTPHASVSGQLHRAMFDAVTTAFACQANNASWFNGQPKVDLINIFVEISERILSTGSANMGPVTKIEVLSAMEACNEKFFKVYIEHKLMYVVIAETRGYLSGFPGDTKLHCHDVARALTDILRLYTLGMLNRTIDRIMPL